MNKWKKVKPARALVCLLMCFMLLGVWALAEGAPVADGGYMPQEVTDPEAVAAAVEEASQQGADPEINILDGLKSIVKSTGFATGEVRQYIMIAVACVLLYLAIVKGFEPLLLLPIAFGMLMLGNLMRVSGVVERLNKTAQNELCNIVTIFLGLTVGATTQGPTFLTWSTIKIVILGVLAFGCGTAGGVLLAKLMNVLSGGKINPLIGSAGVSAVPMAARVSQKEGQREDPGNFLLMHAMGPNVAGVIGSAVAAGVFIALFAK